MVLSEFFQHCFASGDGGSKLVGSGHLLRFKNDNPGTNGAWLILVLYLLDGLSAVFKFLSRCWIAS